MGLHALQKNAAAFSGLSPRRSQGLVVPWGIRTVWEPMSAYPKSFRRIKHGRSYRPHAHSRCSRHDDKASGGSPNGSFFRPIPERARGAIPPCVPGSSRSRRRRGVGRARGAAPPNADIITRRLIGDGQCREIAALRRPSARFSLSRCARILCFGTEADPLPYLI
jgi:hypothetical protein